MKGCTPFSDKELERLLQRLKGKYKSRNAALIVLGVRTGFRISELLSLTIGDIWQFGSVVSVIHVRRGAMKGKKEGRTVPVHGEVRPYLREWVRESLKSGQHPESPLFWSQKDPSKPITRFQADRIIKMAGERARLTGKIGTHSMRKTFARRVFEKLDENIFKTQQALGHKNPASTVNYLSFMQSEIDEAILSED